MGFFDRFKKKKVTTTISTETINEFYKGNNVFKYVNGMQKVILSFKEQILSDKFENVFLCNISYNQLGRPSLIDLQTDEQLIGFEQVIIQLDLEKMKGSSEYSKIVFDKLLSFSRIKELHDNEFSSVNDNKNGNYVGSIDENMNVFMNDEIGSVVELLPSTNDIHTKYNEYFKESDDTSFESLDTKERIDLLKEELNSLTGNENHTNSKSK